MLLAECPGALRADLRRYYGLSMGDARALGVLEVADLAHHLPQDAAVWRALDPDRVWGLTEQLLATVVDEVRIMQWMYELAHHRKGPRPKPPQRIPRPGITQPEDEDTTTYGGRASALPTDEMAEWLGWT